MGLRLEDFAHRRSYTLAFTCIPRVGRNNFRILMTAAPNHWKQRTEFELSTDKLEFL